VTPNQTPVAQEPLAVLVEEPDTREPTDEAPATPALSIVDERTPEKLPVGSASEAPVRVERSIATPPKIEAEPGEPVMTIDPPILEEPDPDMRYRFDEVDAPPTAISTRMPAFEVKGRRLARGQSLTLDVLVSPHGRINSVRVVEGIDNEELRQAAVGAVLRWRFGGGSHRGVPVRVWVPVHLTFYLESGQLRAAVTSLGN